LPTTIEQVADQLETDFREVSYFFLLTTCLRRPVRMRRLRPWSETQLIGGRIIEVLTPREVRSPCVRQSERWGKKERRARSVRALTQFTRLQWLANTHRIAASAAAAASVRSVQSISCAPTPSETSRYPSPRPPHLPRSCSHLTLHATGYIGCRPMYPVIRAQDRPTGLQDDPIDDKRTKSCGIVGSM